MTATVNPNISGIVDPTNLLSATIVQNGAVGTVLVNPLVQATTTVNAYTQMAIQNKNTGANASSDHIAYPNNNTNDVSGFADIGVTGSNFADTAYTVTVANEGYLFASAPAGAGTSGSLVLATDITGTNNNIDFFVAGFNKIKSAFSLRIVGSNGLLQIAEGLGITAKTIVNNGATVTYTVAAKKSYVYITTTAASMAFTLPSAAAAIDGLVVIVCPSAAVATVTWASTGATFVGAPAAISANVPVRMIYDHASLIWYPA